ncbi:MAG TPA: NAD(+) diphosphatase [Rhodanobacteraceae bacterium]|nr:NAD(+) diphosphatase [Rhodanobacteraceae bacterium]
MSSAERTRRNRFTASPLDRCGEYRADPGWLAAQRAALGARFLVFDQDGCAPVVGARLCWLDGAAVAAEAAVNFLGRLDDVPVFALRDPVDHGVLPAAAWLNLRRMAMELERPEAGLVAYARGLANWQDATRHCAYCGGALALIDGGHRARCAQCQRLHFPRTDAAIIVIVEHADACLLGRQAAWPPGQYSTLAGFVEPGESLADAVRREVREETGIEVVDCDFHSSQPWPFPASLMLGFTARAAARAITLADGELEDARWFSAREIEAGLRDGSLKLSSPLSISHRLIEHWLRERAGVDLASFPRAG